MAMGVALLLTLLTGCNLGLSLGLDWVDPGNGDDTAVDSATPTVDTADTAVEANASCNGQSATVSLTGKGAYTMTSAAWYHEARSATLFAVEGYNDACDVASRLTETGYYNGVQFKAFVKNWTADDGTMVGVVANDPVSSSGPYALVSFQQPGTSLFESGVNGSIQIHSGFAYGNDLDATLNVVFGGGGSGSSSQSGTADGDLTACWCPILNSAFN